MGFNANLLRYHQVHHLPNHLIPINLTQRMEIQVAKREVLMDNRERRQGMLESEDLSTMTSYLKISMLQLTLMSQKMNTLSHPVMMSPPYPMIERGTCSPTA